MTEPPAAESMTPGERRPPGRPRSAHLDRIILEAAGELLAEQGYGATSIEAVARRAGVGKTTIYRRWRSKEELTAELLSQIAAEMMPVPDLGDTGAELLHLVRGTIERITRTPAGGVFRGLVSELSRSAELGDLFRRRVVDLRRTGVREVIERGVARGDLRADTDAAIAHELLIGPIYYRFLFGGGRLDRRFGERIVRAFLCGAAAEDIRRGEGIRSAASSSRSGV